MVKLKNAINKIRRLLNYDFDKTAVELKKISDQVYRLEEEITSINNVIKNTDFCYIEKTNRNILSKFNFVNLELLQLSRLDITDNKKVLVCGFYGAINLGDELMLETILSTLDKIGKFDITIMLSDNPNLDITKYGKYHFIHYCKTMTDFNLLATSYDCLIFGGGAIIDDLNYKNKDDISLGNILVNLSMRFITFEKKCILYGLSSNKTLNDKEFLYKLDYVAKNATYFSLRDTNSLEVLKKSGIDVSRIKIVDDIVFANDFSISAKIKNKNELKIGIIYICTYDDEQWLIKNTKIIIDYLKNKNSKYSITFIPFYNFQNNDPKIYARIKQQILDDNIYISDFPKNIEDIKSILKDKDYIISMRYHSTLISNIMNKKVLSIDYLQHRHYYNKINYIYEKYNFVKNNVPFPKYIRKENLDMLFNDINEQTSYSLLNNKAKNDLFNALSLINKNENLQE